MPKLRHADGRVHWSHIKAFAQTARHYAHAIQTQKAQTPAMLFGALVEALVWPGMREYAVWSGDRRQGKSWEAFETLNAGRMIATTPEYTRAMYAADAVLTDPVAAPYLVGDVQRRLEWSAFGLDCAGTPDVIGATFISDLKVTPDVEPLGLQRHARKQLWPQQLVWYEQAIRRQELVLIAVEAHPPHVVTVARLTPRMVERCHQSLVLWTEKLRSCDATGRLPGYSDCVVDLDVDDWERSEDDEDE